MDDSKLEYATEVVGEVVGVFENELIQTENEFLFKHRNLTPDFWEQRQYSALNKFNREIKAKGRTFLENVNKAIHNTVQVSYEDEPKRELAKIEKAVQTEVEDKTKIILNFALASQKRKIIQIKRLAKTEELAKSIEKITVGNVISGVKVKTKSGQNWGLKEYLEMQTRSIPQKENLEFLISAGEGARVVFYICNFFRDCATDHAKYQGLKYYDAKYKEFGLAKEVEDKVTEFIRKNRLVSIQEITENKPYLTTRPNCRHRFNPLSLEQAMSIPSSELLRTLDIESGKYKKDNYEKTQLQRAYERKIRNLKYKIEQLDAFPTKDVKTIARYKKTLKTAQNGLRTLVRENPSLLQRDTRRETRKIVLQDLGARYTHKILDT